MNDTVKFAGFWSATLSLVFAIVYSVFQILSSLRIIPHPQDLFWLFLPSLFLAPAFLVAVICLHYSTIPGLRLWTAMGWSFAILYCVCATIVYFTELTVVLPLQLKGSIDSRHVLIFDRRTFLMAVDCLGYFFMSLASLFTALAFRLSHKWLYRWLLWNGLLMPVLILAFFYPVFYYVGSIWMVTFPLAMINAARFFTNERTLVVPPSAVNSRIMA